MTFPMTFRKLLFVCSQGQNRSRTGSDLYARMGYETKCAGVHSSSNPLTADMLEWADAVFVFEQDHAREIELRWPQHGKPVFNFDIWNYRPYGDPALEIEIKRKMRRWLDEH